MSTGGTYRMPATCFYADATGAHYSLVPSLAFRAPSENRYRSLLR